MFKAMRLGLGCLAVVILSVVAVHAEEVKDHTYSAGVTISHITYEEPSVNVEETGVFVGLMGSYAYRGELFEELPDTMLKAEGRLAFGQVDYDGQLQDGTPYKIENIDDMLFEIRGLAGYDFSVFSDSTITPYFGIGYRYLSDDLSEDRAGYLRQSNYLYSPIGVELKIPLSDGWSIGAAIEYDIFWLGVQRSNLSDVNTSLSDVSNEQKDGYGLRGSISVRKKMDQFNLLIEPYVCYWDIDRSEDAALAFAGTVIGSAYEPANTSMEIGIKLAAEF